MKLNKLIAIVILVLLVGMVAWGCWNWLSPKKATPTVDLPVGDDMATQIKKGATIYTKNVPDYVLAGGTGVFTADFSATVKVTSVQNTGTILGEITSFTNIVGQNPEHNTVILYLCRPLLTKAEQLPDGTIAYSGVTYPQIVVGQSYDVFGILQNPWQDYPYVYISSPLAFEQTAGDNGFDSESSVLVTKPIDSDKMPALQEEVDNGHLPELLKPQLVAFDFLVHELAIPGSTVSNVQDEKQPNGQRNVTVSLQDGRTIQLVLIQPVRTGPTGIWCVKKFRFVQ